MKYKLHSLVCIAGLSVLPLLADEPETQPLSVEQRLRETDLSLAIRQYERVKMEAFETRLKLDLLATDVDMTDTARKKRAELLQQRFELLQSRIAELREVALKLERAQSAKSSHASDEKAKDSQRRGGESRKLAALRAQLAGLRLQFTDDNAWVQQKLGQIRQVEAEEHLR